MQYSCRSLISVLSLSVNSYMHTRSCELLLTSNADAPIASLTILTILTTDGNAVMPGTVQTSSRP